MPFQKGNEFGKLKGKHKKQYSEMLEKAVPAAIDTIIDLAINGRSEKIRLQASQAILDRCYGRPRLMMDVSHKQPIDNKAIMAALADQARGVIFEDSEGQRLVVSPAEIPAAIEVEAVDVPMQGTLQALQSAD